MNFKNKYTVNPSILLKVVSLLLLQTVLTNCYDFNRSTTGVVFSVYVHQSKIAGAKEPDWCSYTLNDVKTMTNLIATRFIKILAFGAAAPPADRPCKNSNTYQNFSQIHAGEAAALVNKDMSNSSKILPSIQVYLGVWLDLDLSVFQKEFRLALKSAKKANSIFQNTVLGIVFGGDIFAMNVNALEFVLDELDKLKNVSNGLPLDLKFGTKQNCSGFDFDHTNTNNNLQYINELRRNIVNKTDFIICEIIPDTHLGIRTAVKIAVDKFNSQKIMLKGINSQIEVMGNTEWPAKATNITEVNAMNDYWQMVDEWASKTNTNVWMNEAIDNPWKNWGSRGHLGWWTLKDDSKTGTLDGYLEKAKLLTKEKKAVRTNRASQNFIQSSFVLAFFWVFVNKFSLFVSKLI